MRSKSEKKEKERAAPVAAVSTQISPPTVRNIPTFVEWVKYS